MAQKTCFPTQGEAPCCDFHAPLPSAARDQVERLTPATLSKAFRGDLVPQDPNDEPASVMLRKVIEKTSSVSKPKLLAIRSPVPI